MHHHVGTGGVALERYADVAPLAQEWDDLAERCGASPLVRPGWVSAWWRAFGSGRLEIAALRRDGRLVAVLPLRRHMLTVRSLFNWHQMEFAAVAEDEADRIDLFDALFEAERGRVVIRLVERAGPDYEACVGAARDRNRWVLTRVVQRSPYLAIDDGDWERYLRSVPQRALAEIRRRKRRLQAQGELRFRVSDGGENLEEDLAAGFAIEGSGWKGKTAITADPATHAFYTEVARWAARRGWLRLAFLELQGVPIAFAFMLQTSAEVLQLKSGYDPRHRKDAPGVLLRYELLARAFEEKLARFEFLGDETAAKRVWTHTARERMAIEVLPKSPIGVAARATAAARPHVKRIRAVKRKSNTPHPRTGEAGGSEQLQRADEPAEGPGARASRARTPV
jgi:CelD/BcsL family acetyltransferase involved in cellulose biosynthesis